MKQVHTWHDNVFRPSITNRKTLGDIPFDTLARSSDTKEWAKDNLISKKMSWVLPQLYAKVGNFTLPKTEDGKIDGAKFWAENVDPKDPKSVGIYRFFQIHPRGNIVADQNKPNGRHYCRLVPLILSAVKQMQNVPYSAWDKNTLKHVVDPDLCAAMLAEPMNFTKDEILCLRDTGLAIKSGDKAGGMRNPLTYSRVHTTGVDDFDSMPELWKIMITQIWCAHPANRMDCMVLDPLNWDVEPEPLIGGKIFSEPKHTVDLPWEVDHTEENMTLTKLKQEKTTHETDLPWGD